MDKEKFNFVGINNNGHVFKSDKRMVIVRNADLSLDDLVIKNRTFDNGYIEKYNVISNIKGEMTIYETIPDEEIIKMRKKTKRIIESYDKYKNDVYPIAMKQDRQWIYNILEKKQEADTIIFENNNFILLPDLKWDGKDLKSMYFLAIVKRRDLLSIRELTEKELPLLEDIYYTGLKIIKEKYGKDETDFRVYFHYHPTYWHLHIHFTILDGSYYSSVDNCHLLLNVIDNIKMNGRYYQKMNLEVIKKVL